MASERARPNWDEYFLEFAGLARSRSTCLRRGVGAVIVVEKNIVATGGQEYEPSEYGYNDSERIITQRQLEDLMAERQAME